jgi:hypothetical protein
MTQVPSPVDIYRLRYTIYIKLAVNTAGFQKKKVLWKVYGKAKGCIMKGLVSGLLRRPPASCSR